jgi:hypothetical protein
MSNSKLGLSVKTLQKIFSSKAFASLVPLALTHITPSLFHDVLPPGPCTKSRDLPIFEDTKSRTSGQGRELDMSKV